MNLNQLDSLGQSTQWIQTCLPEPTSKDFHTQLGVFCEEVSEMLCEVSVYNSLSNELIYNAVEAMQSLSNHLKANNLQVYIEPDNRKAFLSEMCDVAVTLTTTAHTQQLQITDAMHAINEANFSKFENGVPLFNSNGKVIKGRDYKKADLSLFV